MDHDRSSNDQLNRVTAYFFYFSYIYNTFKSLGLMWFFFFLEINY